VKIAAVTWRDRANPNAGGAELLIDRLLSGLMARGHDVTMVCGGPVGQHPYPVIDAGGEFSQYLRAPSLCTRYLRDVDVLIDCENGLPFFSPLWRRGPSVCLVHHIHTDQWRDRFPKFLASSLSAMERHVMPALYRRRPFVAISSSTADGLVRLGVERERIDVIECGVDIPGRSAHQKSVEPLFVSLNRLVPHKRIGLLLDAWERAGAAISGRLVIAGDGPELDALRKRASRLPGVEVLGRISEEAKEELLAEAWAVLSAAHHEGWGLSILEAAAVGTPSLAIDAPGIRDAVADGSTGILVREADESEVPYALAKAIVAFVNDPERRQAMGAAAKCRAREFSWDRFVDAWEVVLENARSAPGGTGLTRKNRDNRAFVGEIQRSIRLLRGFRTQYEDREGFYSTLADDTVDLVKEYHPIPESKVVDVGGGPGYFAEAFRLAGADSVFVEPEWEAINERGVQPRFGIIGDGLELPFADGAFDIGHSSNVLEHVTDPKRFLDELLRVIRPGGVMFLAFTNWYSPFGGHETSPWHYLGGERAALRYKRKHGAEPKNRIGSSLFRLDIADVLSFVRDRQDSDLIDAFPRYYPRWTKPMVSVPGVREFATWNLVIVLRRR
jgi:glycosyltransferase involved in cell wall biosynthesis/SAM-dependent methyltransferase